MKTFHCGKCEQLVFFENVRCVKCDHALCYLPGREIMEPFTSKQPADVGLRELVGAAANGQSYRLCQNYSRENVCNWAVLASDGNPLCRSCRLTRTIPDLSRPGNREAWYRLEVAKRRLVYTLQGLGLGLANRKDDPVSGLAFDFLADPDAPGSPPVLTGHNQGIITVNVAEADDAEREKRRVSMNEPFRTLLGHFRHEIGHYYWNRLIKPGDRIDEFRKRFGDERQDYAEALQRHYHDGASADWPQHFISAYASSHPWEDWAETWAHYLHMVDALETAGDCGLILRPKRADEPAVRTDTLPRVGCRPESFDRMIAGWFPLVYVLNNLNRGLGLQDGYPFVLSSPVIDKLRFVHEVVVASGA